MLETSHALECLPEVIVAQVVCSTNEFVHHQLHPELSGLVLNDEQQFIVVITQGLLC